MMAGRLRGRRVAIGVCGGIAAYKAIECIRLLTEAGAEVRVLMTPEATRFVTPLTFEALSDNPVAADWLAFAAALLWLLHPLQTEVVDYVTQRTESMMGFFYLLTLYAAIRSMTASAGAFVALRR